MHLKLSYHTLSPYPPPHKAPQSLSTFPAHQVDDGMRAEKSYRRAFTHFTLETSITIHPFIHLPDNGNLPQCFSMGSLVCFLRNGDIPMDPILSALMDSSSPRSFRWWGFFPKVIRGEVNIHISHKCHTVVSHISGKMNINCPQPSKYHAMCILWGKKRTPSWIYNEFFCSHEHKSRTSTTYTSHSLHSYENFRNYKAFRNSKWK